MSPLTGPMCTQNHTGGEGLWRVTFGGHSQATAPAPRQRHLRGLPLPRHGAAFGSGLRDLELCSPRATVSAAAHICSISQICRRVCPSWRNLSERFGPKEPPKAQAQTEPDPNHVAAPRPSPLCPHPFLAGFLSSSLRLPRPTPQDTRRLCAGRGPPITPAPALPPPLSPE